MPQTARKENVFCARPVARPLRPKERSYEDETKTLERKTEFPNQAMLQISPLFPKKKFTKCEKPLAWERVLCMRPGLRPQWPTQASYRAINKTNRSVFL